jgi:hypothetical protein
LRATPLSWCCLFVLAGCASGSSDGTNDAANPDAGNSHTATRLAFEPADALRLAPGDQRRIHVRVTPPGRYHVEFALIGQPLAKDASLDRSEADTADDGTVTALLTAPTSVTLFTLRAALNDKVSSELPVSVSSDGFATLEVKPLYSGKREVSYWVASVRQGVKCSQLASNYPPTDGDLVGEAAAGQSPKIESIPLGVDLALTLRAGYFAAGCASLGALLPNRANRVELSATDVPLQLTGSSLSLSLASNTPATQLSAVLSNGSNALLTALRKGATDDVDALLNAMHAQLQPPTAAAAFSSARTSKGWDAALKSALGARAATAIRAPAESWMKQGVAGLSPARAFAGVLRTSASGTGATLELSTVAGVDAVEAGFARSNPISVSAKANDTILLGATQGDTADQRLRWSPSRLVAALARRPAQLDVPGTASVAQALSEKLSCSLVASTLVKSGLEPGASFSGCNASCNEQLCRTALLRLWENARDASTELRINGNLSVSAAGAASVDAYARPVRLSGTWIGTLGANSETTELRGDMQATSASPVE